MFPKCFIKRIHESDITERLTVIRTLQCKKRGKK